MNSGRPFYDRASEAIAGAMPALITILLSIAFVAVLWSWQRAKESRCKSAGGVWVGAYKSPGHCLIVRDGKLTEIEP